MEQKIIPCLEILAISGKKNSKIELGIDRRKGIIDLSPWFEKAFECRDYYHPKIDRIEKRKDYTTISFNMVEFAEAFFGRYGSKELVNFLNPHFVEGEFEKEFLGRADSFEKENRMAFFFCLNMGRGDSWGYLVPHNLSLEELKESAKVALPKSYFRGRRHKEMSCHSSRKEIKEKVGEKQVCGALFYKSHSKGKFSLHALREKFLEQMSPLIIVPLTHIAWLTNLNYFDFIQDYDLDTSGLVVDKRS